ncbi:SRPBCC family protein [Planktothrix sp. FACHB-1365]|uniref:SRPBCC family protein n=1 Tax=Planktothrix sp. FACHB-1365 TaxID=2692855 RepID=UPI001687B2C8|nr:SRPBCC family protein [Planktothrix sp. FACHB-1365]MBD2482286.1 SRPBCC family protein [Planktothrix sp. FACHB-1365]
MEEITSTPKYDHPPSEENPSDLERWGSLIGGGALVLMGLQQHSLKGVLMAIAGGGLMYQATQNKSTLHQAQEALGLNKSQNIRVEKTVTINRSGDELYEFWRNFYNLPRFMKHIKSIIVYDEHRSHWVATAPLGTTVEWDAEIIKDEPNHLIAWSSVENAEIGNSGFVRFQPAPADRGTEVKVVIEFNPPGGAVTTTLAKLFGEEPEQQIGDDLNRFKQLMEAGEIARNTDQ